MLPLALLLTATLAAPLKTDTICIVGAGGSGLMTARQLVKKGYTAVKVIEKNGVVGGKAYNYVDAQGYQHPMGPEGGWDGYTTTMSLLREFGVTWTNNTSTMKTVIFEPVTGTKIVNPAPADPVAFQAAYNKYLTLRAQYAPYLANGYTSGVLPAVLYTPFSSFITTNGLQALLPSIYASVVSYGYGALDTFPTLYALKTLTPGKMKVAVDKTSSFNTDYALLLTKMAASLTTVQITPRATIYAVTRTTTGVTLQFAANNKDNTLNCKVLINAFAPTLKNLEFWGLDSTETNVLQNVQTEKYASSIGYIPSTSIERNAIYFGTLGYDATKNPSIFPSEPKGDMKPLAIKKFNPNSDYAITFNWQYRNRTEPPYVIADTAKQYLSGPLTNKYPVFLNLSMLHDYSPKVTNEAIKAGFFTNFKNLQGYRSTYYISGLTSFELMEDVFNGAIDFVNTYF